MKQLLNKVHTPDSWKQELYAEIEKDRFKEKRRIPKWVFRAIAGTAAVCTAIIMAVTLTPDNYTLLLSAAEVGEIVAREENIKTNMYTNKTCTALKEYFPRDYGLNSKDGNTPVELWAVMPVRVYGDNIESVTFIPKNATMVVYSYYNSKDIPKYGNEEIEVSEITIPYDEQFKLDYVLELKWDAVDNALEYHPETDTYTHYYAPLQYWKAVKESSVELQIKMKNGTVRTETIDVGFREEGSSWDCLYATYKIADKNRE